MKTENKTRITKDFDEKSVIVSRVFDVPAAKVWKAFTIDKLLDRWWGPLPWRAETKIMNFTPGGYWLYAMVSPENEKHWGRMNYLAIDEYKKFELEDAFCDENGNWFVRKVLFRRLHLSAGNNQIRLQLPCILFKPLFRPVKKEYIYLTVICK